MITIVATRPMMVVQVFTIVTRMQPRLALEVETTIEAPMTMEEEQIFFA